MKLSNEDKQLLQSYIQSQIEKGVERALAEKGQPKEKEKTILEELDLSSNTPTKAPVEEGAETETKSVDPKDEEIARLKEQLAKAVNATEAKPVDATKILQSIKWEE